VWQNILQFVQPRGLISQLKSFGFASHLDVESQCKRLDEIGTLLDRTLVGSMF
jgi:hypothetical protein